jgi:hypothetical protein
MWWSRESLRFELPLLNLAKIPSLQNLLNDANADPCHFLHNDARLISNDTQQG